MLHDSAVLTVELLPKIWKNLRQLEAVSGPRRPGHSCHETFPAFFIFFGLGSKRKGKPGKRQEQARTTRLSQDPP